MDPKRVWGLGSHRKHPFIQQKSLSFILLTKPTFCVEKENLSAVFPKILEKMQQILINSVTFFTRYKIQMKLVIFCLITDQLFFVTLVPTTVWWHRANASLLRWMFWSGCEAVWLSSSSHFGLSPPVQTQSHIHVTTRNLEETYNAHTSLKGSNPVQN